MNLSAEDIDVIRKALELYLRERQRIYHTSAATADIARALELSVHYQSDQQYIYRLASRLGAAKMDGSAGTSPEPVTKGSSDE